MYPVLEYVILAVDIPTKTTLNDKISSKKKFDDNLHSLVFVGEKPDDEVFDLIPDLNDDMK